MYSLLELMEGRRITLTQGLSRLYTAVAYAHARRNRGSESSCVALFPSSHGDIQCASGKYLAILELDEKRIGMAPVDLATSRGSTQSCIVKVDCHETTKLLTRLVARSAATYWIPFLICHIFPTAGQFDARTNLRSLCEIQCCVQDMLLLGPIEIRLACCDNPANRISHVSHTFTF